MTLEQVEALSRSAQMDHYHRKEYLVTAHMDPLGERVSVSEGQNQDRSLSICLCQTVFQAEVIERISSQLSSQRLD